MFYTIIKMNRKAIYNNYNLGLFPLIHITNQNKDPKLKVKCYYHNSIITTDFFEFQQFLKFENERQDFNYLLSLCKKHKKKITEFCEECLMNLCPDCLLRHNEFHSKKNLFNIMNSITNEKINQFKQKLIEESNNIILIQKNSNQLIIDLKKQIEKLEKFTKDFIEQQKIQIDIVQQYLIFFEKKKSEDLNLNFQIIENLKFFWKVIFNEEFDILPNNNQNNFRNNNLFIFNNGNQNLNETYNIFNLPLINNNYTNKEIFINNNNNQTNFKKYQNLNYNDLIYYLSSPNNQLLLNNIILKNDYFSKIEERIFLKNIEQNKFLSNIKNFSTIQENYIIKISKLSRNKIILILQGGYIKIYDFKRSLKTPIYSNHFNNRNIENIFILQNEIIILNINNDKVLFNNNNNNNLIIMEPKINERIMYSLIDWNFNLNIKCYLIYELENQKLLLLAKEKMFIFHLKNDSDLYEFRNKYQLETVIMQSINLDNSNKLVQFNKNYIAYISQKYLSIFDLNNLRNKIHNINLNYVDYISKIEENILAVCSNNKLYLISGISLSIFYTFEPNYNNCFIRNANLYQQLQLKFLVKISDNNYVTNNMIQIYISENYISLIPTQNLELINNDNLIALDSDILVILSSPNLIKLYSYFD